MKKLVVFIASFFLTAVIAVFAGCGAHAPQTAETLLLEGSALVVLDNGRKEDENRYTEFTVYLSESGLTSSDNGIDVLEALKDQGLYYSGTFSSSFGATLTEIGTQQTSGGADPVQTPILRAGPGSYIALYTSDIEEGNPDSDSDGGTIDYRGRFVYRATEGISDLSVFDGVVYYFVLQNY